jgi:F-type H+-transporting ATPase subunit gamma
MSLKSVKNKIRSIQKTGQVTKAMEAVSAVKMRKSQEAALLGRPYAISALSILKRLSGSAEGLRHPLSQKRDVRRMCLVVVTSDKGLAGSLNSAVLKEAEQVLSLRGIQKKDTKIITVGKRAFEYFSRRNYEIIGNYTNITDNVSVYDMKEIAAEIREGFAKGIFDACAAIYTNFVSTFEQDAVSRPILPLHFEEIESMVEGILPSRGRYARERDKREDKQVSTYTIEPNPEEVLIELIPLLVGILLYHALLEAKASEHSARMVAMKNATDKTEELSRELRLAFNKARQAVITREMNEITSGIETMIN